MKSHRSRLAPCSIHLAAVLLFALIPLGISVDDAEAASTPILGSPQASASQAQAWARRNNASQLFVDLAPLYWQIGPQRGGVRPEVAYTQAALETGWMRFKGGAVPADFHNPCGLKTAKGGSNSDPNAHQRFGSWEDGITACIDHLALYAAAPGYPKPAGSTPDPKHCKCLLGASSTVEGLGGKWAPSPGYGERIVTGLLNPLLGTEAPPSAGAPEVRAPAPESEKLVPVEELTGLPEEPPAPAAIRVASLRLAGLGMATAVESA